MAIAFGAQQTGEQTAASDATIANASALSCNAGELIVVLISIRDAGTISSVVGSLNGSYTAAGALQTNAGTTLGAAVYYFENSAAGSETVTVTVSGNVRGSVNVSSWTGAATTSALDQNNGAETDASTTPGHGSITTTGAGLIITSMAISGDPGSTTQSGFTALTRGATYTRDWYGYRIVTGSTTEDGDLSTTNSLTFAGKIASFNEAAAASTYKKRRISLMGVG